MGCRKKGKCVRSRRIMEMETPILIHSNFFVFMETVDIHTSSAWRKSFYGVGLASSLIDYEICSKKEANSDAALHCFGTSKKLAGRGVWWVPSMSHSSCHSRHSCFLFFSHCWM